VLPKPVLDFFSEYFPATDKCARLDCHILEIATSTFGDNRAEIELLYHRHGPALLLFALTIACDRGRAQDALQQVFLKD
jgi:hypothetical protein